MPAGTRPNPPSGTARVAISGTTDGHQWVNTFWLNLAHSSAVTVNDLQDIADFISAAWNSDIAVSLAPTVIMNQVAVTYYPTSTTVLAYVGTYSHAGTSTTAVADASACFVIDFVISSLYRGGKPRWYLPGVPVAKVTSGSNIDAAWLSAIATNINTLRNALNAHTTTNVTAITMGVVRFVDKKAWLTPPVFWPYTSVKPGKRFKLGSQRRRILS